MTMLKLLKQRIKKLFENTESTITNIILLALFGGSATVLAVSKKALSAFLLIATTPTPLWATISLVLLGCLYTYKKARKEHPSTSSPSSADVIIDEVKTKILVLLVNKTELMTSESISSSINAHLQTTLFHLNELVKLQMITSTHGGWSNIPANWNITQNGRLYLSKNNLLP